MVTHPPHPSAPSPSADLATSATPEAEPAAPTSERVRWPWIVVGLVVLVLGAILGLIMSSVGA